jgi:hypothetical protein
MKGYKDTKNLTADYSISQLLFLFSKLNISNIMPCFFVVILLRGYILLSLQLHVFLAGGTGFDGDVGVGDGGGGVGAF